MPRLPKVLKDIILEYHGSMVEYDKRLRLHEELFRHYNELLRMRLNEEFSFIFYPGFFQDLEVIVVAVPPTVA